MRQAGSLSYVAHEHILQAIRTADPLVIQPAVITHPRAVDSVVFARGVAVNFFLARADEDVTAGRTTGADAPGFLEEPYAHLETEILRCERAHWTNVHRVQRVIIVESFARKRRERVEAAAIDDAERVVAHDVLREPDAARTEDAAFIIEHDTRTKVNHLGLVNLGLHEAARALAVIHRVFL